MDLAVLERQIHEVKQQLKMALRKFMCDEICYSHLVSVKHDTFIHSFHGKVFTCAKQLNQVDTAIQKECTCAL
jgi:hypothetical protein